ncbi:NADP-dependent oxidoreductase [Curtobacterium sp. Leaf261]|uniref:NADP-dependent oxidoreductase n=1 Tax=Curtobacterium sp. Leaf261 TaxID=1736311 RepID=UPI00138F7E21|nr:NADP-dependent oxidoreductase [Curtobacterium sp. Leaf261]
MGRAVEYDHYGDFDVVHIVPQERPKAREGEIVVEVIAAGLNHIERFVREGRLQGRVDIEFPARQGTCFAGIVKERGPGVKDLAVGAEVMGHAIGGGAHATWVRVPRTAVVKKPATMAFEVAGGLYLAGCTAKSIVDELALGPDDVVVISAAAGGVGHLECQLAQIAGAQVIGTCSPRNHDYLRQIGIHPVTYGDGLEERIAEAAKGRPVTAFIDNHGGDNPALSESLGVPADRFVSSDHRREVEIRFLRAPAEDAEVTRLLTELSGLIEHHKLRLLISGFYPFEYIVDAYEDLAEMHSRGKVVVGMQPVETGARLSWYRSQKARTVHER